MKIFSLTKKFPLPKRLLCGVTAFFFVASTLFPNTSMAQTIPQTVLNLPVPGTMVSLSPSFTPTMIKGMTIYPDDPFKFDFIIDRGDTTLEGDDFKAESAKLIKYFLASLTTSEEKMWVNLSPTEKDRIIADGFDTTEMGRDLLAQDYILKQLTASLLYPENELAKTFWNKVYAQAQEKLGTNDIPMDTFNKVWIIPERAEVYVHGKSAFVVGSHLKVMLEEDYKSGQRSVLSDQEKQQLTTRTMKEIIIPEIEKEINEGKNFAQLRQIYHSLILATWYKKNLKKSLFGQVYVDKNKTKGVDVEDKQIKQKIYEQYLAAFKKGAYDYIKEDYDPATQEVVTKKYFSGGVNYAQLAEIQHEVSTPGDFAKLVETEGHPQVVTARIETTQGDAAKPGNDSLSSTQLQKAGVSRRLTISGIAAGVILSTYVFGSFVWDKNIGEVGNIVNVPTRVSAYYQYFKQNEFPVVISYQESFTNDMNRTLAYLKKDFPRLHELLVKEGIVILENSSSTNNSFGGEEGQYRYRKKPDSNEKILERILRITPLFYGVGEPKNDAPVFADEVAHEFTHYFQKKLGYLKYEDVLDELEAWLVQLLLFKKATGNFKDINLTGYYKNEKYGFITHLTDVDKDEFPKVLEEIKYIFNRHGLKFVDWNGLQQEFDSFYKALNGDDNRAREEAQNELRIRFRNRIEIAIHNISKIADNNILGNDFEALAAAHEAATLNSSTNKKDAAMTSDGTSGKNDISQQVNNRGTVATGVVITAATLGAFYTGYVFLQSPEVAASRRDVVNQVVASNVSTNERAQQILSEIKKLSNDHPLIAMRIDLLTDASPQEALQFISERLQGSAENIKNFPRETQKKFIESLGQIGTPKAIDLIPAYLEERGHVLSPEEKDVSAEIIKALGKSRTPEGAQRLLGIIGNHERDFNVFLFSALKTSYSPQTREVYVKSLNNGKVDSVNRFIVSTFAAETAPLKPPIQLLNLLSRTGSQAESIIKEAVAKYVDVQLQWFNINIEENVEQSEEALQKYLEEIKDPRAVYLIMALSQEITSHSFPVFYKRLKDFAIKRGYKDVQEYVEKEFNNVFLPEFIFTLTLHGHLIDVFTSGTYMSSQIVEKVLDNDNVSLMLKEPVLFSKIVKGIWDLNNPSIREATMQRLMITASQDIRVTVMLKLMKDSQMLSTTEAEQVEKFVNNLSLPTLNPSFTGPQHSWFKKNPSGKGEILEMGMFWDGSSQSAHMSMFPQIFGGKSGELYYKNFAGYKDLSKDPAYAPKLKEHGANQLLVKEFANGSEVHFYVYFNLNRLKERSKDFNFNITRSHSGARDINTYAGNEGTARFSNACRSAAYILQLLEANSDSVVIAVNASKATALKANVVLYYFAEFMAERVAPNPKRGFTWEEFVDYVAQDNPKAIEDYTFPTREDWSVVYGAIIQKLKLQGKLTELLDRKIADRPMLVGQYDDLNLEEEVVPNISLHNIPGVGPTYVYFDRNQTIKDAAMNPQNPGGIDLNPNKMDLQTKGEEAPLYAPVDPAMLEKMNNIDGAYPVIINVAPVLNLPLLLGIKKPLREENLSYAK